MNLDPHWDSILKSTARHSRVSLLFLTPHILPFDRTRAHVVMWRLSKCPVILNAGTRGHVN